jgi:hypothetical protein
VELADKLKYRILHSWRTLADRELPVASSRESELVRSLRTTFSRLEQTSEAHASHVDSYWNNQRSKLRQFVADRDPREFLRWEPIESTMCVGDYPYVIDELRYLQSRTDWTGRWKAAVRESTAGRPRKFAWFPQSSGTLIHHAYHLARFEETTGLNVAQMRTIVEFGGGYGNMCRLVHRLGFSGQYLIFDLPELCALQDFFLDLDDVGPTGINTENKPRPKFVTDLAMLSDLIRSQRRPSLLIGTWSLSEAPIPLRASIMKMISFFDALLIAYQEEFAEIDNVSFFSGWKENEERAFTIQDFPIPHLPGNRYLMAGRRNEAFQA